ncbi:hypothetical protein ACN42_g8535 [Penicillium freii]|uniref:Uncharacterized protein n=1 Tax=Penicillium freii TaxID=48697 RepID=A0A101MDS4_PENFR|nr:hypothetical protein ACN42_g8535 [Penicillium freii]
MTTLNYKHSFNLHTLPPSYPPHPLQSTVHFNKLSTSITTSLTVAGSGFRTIGRLVSQPSMIHLDQLPTSNPPPL